MIVRRVSQILPNVPVEQQVHIVYWGVIDQPIQFAGFVHIPGDLAFDSDTVNRDYAIALGVNQDVFVTFKPENQKNKRFENVLLSLLQMICKTDE